MLLAGRFSCLCGGAPVYGSQRVPETDALGVLRGLPIAGLVLYLSAHMDAFRAVRHLKGHQRCVQAPE